MNIDHALYAALTRLRESTGGPGMAPVLGEAFKLLDDAGTFTHLDTWQRANGWPTRPTVHRELGVQARRRRVVNGVRVAGDCPTFIVAQTREWVIYETFSPEGQHLGEVTIKKTDFAIQFERKE